MLNEMIKETLNKGISTMNIYRHFKGGYYIVHSLATVEADSDGEEVVVYQSLQDGRVWLRPLSSFQELVPEGKENPTGQKYRFERVTTFNNQLNLIPTEELMKELLRRNDCPVELQCLNPDKVWRDNYMVGRYETTYLTHEESTEDFYAFNIFNSLERAVQYAHDHPKSEILRRVYIKQDFD